MDRVENDLGIDLVADDDDVVALAQCGDDFELAAPEDLARRVVRGIEDQRTRARAKGRGELVGIETPVGQSQRHGAWDAASHQDVGNIGIVGRLEDDDFVAGIDGGHHGVVQKFRRAAGDGDLGVGIGRARVRMAAAPVVGERLAQSRNPGAGRVLISVLADVPHGRFLDEFRGREIGKSLPQVDGAVAGAERRDLGEDRRAEAADAVGASTSPHGPNTSSTRPAVPYPQRCLLGAHAAALWDCPRLPRVGCASGRKRGPVIRRHANRQDQRGAHHHAHGRHQGPVVAGPGARIVAQAGSFGRRRDQHGRWNHRRGRR